MILRERDYGSDCRESEDNHGSGNDGDYRHLHFLLFDFLTDVFGSAPDHQTADEDGDNDIDENAVETRAHTAKDDFVGLDVEQRNQAAERREAVVHSDDGS